LAPVKERISKIRWIGTVLGGARTQREITGLRHVGPYVGFTTAEVNNWRFSVREGKWKIPRFPQESSRYPYKTGRLEWNVTRAQNPLWVLRISMRAVRMI